MPNAQTICTRALRLLGVVGAGETPDSTILADAFATLNEMMEGWSLDGLTVPAIARTEFNLVSGTGTYTLGPTGTLVQSPLPGKPLQIGYMLTSTGPEVPLSSRDAHQFQQIPYKTTTGIPRDVWLDTASGGTLYRIQLYPIPNKSGMKLVLYLPIVLTEFADLTTQYSLPKGANRAMRWKLAQDLMPEFEIPPTIDAQMIINNANEYMADYRRSNIKPEVIVPEAPAHTQRGGGYNIYTDE